MRRVNTAQTLDSAEIQMPVQWAFKNRRGNGAHVEVFLRRVKAGNETELADEYDSGFATHFKGKFSDAQTLLSRFNDTALDHCETQWMRNVAHELFEQMGLIMRNNPRLLELFSRKGKMEIYGPNTPYFHAQYISGNFTLKIHVDSLQKDGFSNMFAHLIAQHLDYPFGPGERRFSSSRLFDLCFSAEKVLMPNGLAARIDESLLARGVYQPEHHDIGDYDHTLALLNGGSAQIRTSYERVLQRERFATMIVALYGNKRKILKSPLLDEAYRYLLDADMLVREKEDYKDYPPKKLDELAEAIHVPLALIFNKASDHGSFT